MQDGNVAVVEVNMQSDRVLDSHAVLEMVIDEAGKILQTTIDADQQFMEVWQHPAKSELSQSRATLMCTVLHCHRHS